MHNEKTTSLPQRQSPPSIYSSRSALKTFPRPPTTRTIPINFLGDGRHNFDYLPGEIKNSVRPPRVSESSSQQQPLFRFLGETTRPWLFGELKLRDVGVDNQFGRDWKPYRSRRKIKPGDVPDYWQPGEKRRGCSLFPARTNAISRGLPSPPRFAHAPGTKTKVNGASASSDLSRSES
jgi:hypothetical protein